MSETLQILLVALSIGVAFVFLLRRLGGVTRGEAMCGKCPGCSSARTGCELPWEPPFDDETDAPGGRSNESTGHEPLG
jgi:hypothetical protein